MDSVSVSVCVGRKQRRFALRALVRFFVDASRRQNGLVSVSTDGGGFKMVGGNWRALCAGILVVVRV